MTLAIKIRGPNNTEATLTEAQFKFVEPIIVRMMDGQLPRREAEDEITALLQKVSLPLAFKPQTEPRLRRSKYGTMRPRK